MTDSDLTKYDWRRRLGGGGSGDYYIGAVTCGSDGGPKDNTGATNFRSGGQ